MEINPFDDTYFMKEALKEAQKAFVKDEVPVGAVIVCEKQIIARAHNYTETLNDVTAHAEIQAITAASNTLEPVAIASPIEAPKFANVLEIKLLNKLFC